MSRSWILQATFVQRLPLAIARRWLDLGQPLLLGPGDEWAAGGQRCAALILAGRGRQGSGLVSRDRPAEPGQLIGAGWLGGEAETPPLLSAEGSPMELLVWEERALMAMGEQSGQVLEVLRAVARLDLMLPRLEPALRRENTLRRLSAGQRLQLLQFSALQELETNTPLCRAGLAAEDLFLLLEGSARLESPAGRQELPAGTLVGSFADWTEEPPVQLFDVRLSSRARCLRIPWRGLVELASRNRHLRLAHSELSERMRGSAHLIYAPAPRSGATTLSLGVAEAMRSSLGARGRVAVLDLDGQATLQRLKLRPGPLRIGGLPAEGLRLSSRGEGLLLWPEREEDLRPLLDALLVEGWEVLVTQASGRPPSPEVMDIVENIVLLCSMEQPSAPISVGEHQRLIRALRIPPGGYPVRPLPPVPVELVDEAGEHAAALGRRAVDQALGRGGLPTTDERRGPMSDFVRVPFDAELSDRRLGPEHLDLLGDQGTALGRAAGRLARMLLGRCVGLALSGGGAWGFSHVGLIRALTRAGLPIDMVAGTSVGAVVGGVYVGGPHGRGGARALERLERLVREGRRVERAAFLAYASTVPLGHVVEQLCDGPQHVLSTEVPLLAVTTDMLAPGEANYIMETGSLANAVRAACSFPFFFTPYRVQSGRRLVDGGIVQNLPSMALLSAGCDFVLASNCIPDRPGEVLAGLRRYPALGRALDGMASFLIMMGQASRADAALADYTFTAGPQREAPPWSFSSGHIIAARAEEQAERELAAIQAAYEADTTRARPGNQVYGNFFAQ